MSEHPAPIWEERLRVSPHECDFRLRWKPAAIFLALLKAASEQAATFGFDFENMLTRQTAWVLSRFRMHFHRFPTLREEVILHTWPKGIQQRLFFTRDFTLTGLDGSPLVSATSAWLMINPVTRRLLPPAVVDPRFPMNETLHALDLPLEKINPPEGQPERWLAQAHYSDVDVMEHVNSARYVEWVCNAAGLEAFRERPLAWLQINYIQEVRPADRVSIRAAENGTDSLVMEGYNLDAGTRSFEAAIGYRMPESRAE